MHLQQQDLGASRDTQNHCEHGREFRKSGIVLLPYRMPGGVKIEVPIVVSVANPSLLCLGGLHGARHGYVYNQSFCHRSLAFITHLFSIAP